VPSRFKQFKERHHLAFEVAFFFAGFLFDVLLLHRIDSTPLLIHQGTYLVLSAGLIFWDHRIVVAGVEPTGLLGKVAGYRLWAMHFFLGTLLNAFIVFYFRASSGFWAFVFIVALATVIVLNELPQFRQQGPVVRVALLSFSITSYLAYLIPVLHGELRPWQYFVAVGVGSVCTVVLWQLFRFVTKDQTWTLKRAVLPGLTVQALLAVLYLADAVPPVPLSVKHLALVYSVQPERTPRGLHYLLTFRPAPGWKFWEDHHDELVVAAEEKIYAFVRVFAPTRFQDTVSFVWEFDDPQKGWSDWGKPFDTKLSGGNEEGFRTYAYLTARRAGSYRVRVLSADGREIGRKTFSVVISDDVSKRQVTTERD
jgi:hypothetical protein